MADFDITAPDGKKYRVSGDNAEGAYQALSQMLAQQGMPAQDAMSQPQMGQPSIYDASSPFYDPAAPPAPGGLTGADLAAMAADADRMGYTAPIDEPAGFWGQLGNDLLSGTQAAGAGLSRGALGLIGLPGTVSDVLDNSIMSVGRSAGLISDNMQLPPSPLSSQALIGAASDLTGGATDYRGDNAGSRLAGSAAEFIPGAAAFGGTGLNNLLRYGALPGIASEGAGMATEGTAWEPYARVGAALAAAPLANLAETGIRRAISPYGGADAGRLALAGVLDDAGVPMSAGQRVGNEGLRRREGLTAQGQELGEAQREALTRAALRTTGEDAARATPEVLARAADRIGKVFDDVTVGLTVSPTPQQAAGMRFANETYKTLAPKAARAPLIGEMEKRMAEAANAGTTIPAYTLNSWRSNLSKMTTSSDNATREAAKAALEVVDDAMIASMNAAGRSADVSRLAQAREQWRNLLAVQQAASGAGEAAAAGILSPSALRSAVTGQGRSSYATGRRGELGDLARAAEGVIKPLPTSGTAENLRAMGVPALGWSGGGAALGSTGGPAGAAIGAALGALAPQAMGYARMSSPVQAYLANQLVGKGPNIFERGIVSPIISALTGGQ